MALAFPDINPVALTLGPLQIRWYAVAYLAGFLLGLRYCFALARRPHSVVSMQHFDEFLTWAVIGTILGGRIGYVLFYNSAEYFAHPVEIFKVWQGGMSFHGGMLGVITAAWLYTRKSKINFLAFTDILACVTPIGLFFGRLANFVNGELYGRASDVPWAVVFPHGGSTPRHPSQIYEAGLEGLVLFGILFILSRAAKVRVRIGMLSGAFLFFYGTFRLVVEFFREPDVQLGFFFGGTTMGQMLCAPMIVAGLFLIVRALVRPTLRVVP